MNKIRLLHCSLFLSVFAVIAPVCAHAAEDPVACIEEIGIAVDAADADTFQELVDVDSLLSRGLSAFVNEASKPEISPQLPPVAAMIVQQLAKPGFAGDGLRKMIVNEMRSFVLYGISSGAFAGKSNPGVSSQGMLAPLFANASMGRKEIRHIGKARKDGDDWLVPFIVHDHGNGQNYAVTGRLTNGDNGLKLAEIDNLIELLTQIGNESLEQDAIQ